MLPEAMGVSSLLVRVPSLIGIRYAFLRFSLNSAWEFFIQIVEQASVS
jgi:hypothetical protein